MTFHSAVDRPLEKALRRFASSTSRRSVVSRLGLILAAAPVFPLLPVSRASARDRSTQAKTVFARTAQAKDDTQCDYWRYCAIDGSLCSCHGVTGSSRPAKVPVLRGRIGYFLCLPQGREYLIRLPNVASAAVEDDAALGALMNYVVAEFGGASSVAGSRPYTAAEVSAWRRKPLTATSLVRFRSELVGKMRRQCRNVPATLEKFS